MDDGRAVVHGALRIEDRGQHLVLDLDEIARLLGKHGRLGGDGGDPVADEADLVVEHHRVVRRRLRAVLPGRRERHARHVLVRQDAVDAGERKRLRRVDAFDARVRVRAPLDAAVEHSGR